MPITQFSSDASVFEIVSKKVLTPLTLKDLKKSVQLSLQDELSITLRAGGTSLGGQAIGSGVVIDVSKHLTHILDYQPGLKQVTVEPGVIQDDLNDFVVADGLRFAPDTSTSNRAMIGGMIGNNSCGSYSIYYGTTREHVRSVEVILSDGSEAVFCDLTPEELHEKLKLKSLEGDIYREVVAILESHGEAILANFPHPAIKRRNTGYALDELYRHHQPFNPNGKPFNLTSLICGSEGTLAVVKTATLNLVELPKYRQLFCAHFDSVRAAMEVVPEFLPFKPAAIELIDQPTLDGTQHNREQQQNRFWVEGNPAAVLVVEIFSETAQQLQENLQNYQAWYLSKGAYACPIIDPKDSAKVWALRKAGLGLLMGKPVRKKAVAVIEDAAVPVESLPDYFEDVQALMAELQVGCVYFGHASVGLIHIRPEIDLATQEGKRLFQTIAERNSKLVKKYRGALSGEHGDGRIRAPFIKEQLGDEVYGCLVRLKKVFDPLNLLNPGVIIGDMPITSNLRADRQPKELLTTAFDWSQSLSLMDAVEKCNGAGACRKSAGRGTMCPSYQATREENYSTRGRSNLLRFALTEPNPHKALSQADLQDALEMCLGCKACASECPASVDMAALKSEVLYQTQPKSLSRYLVKHYGVLMRIGANFPSLYNAIQSFGVVKKLLSVEQKRHLPTLADQSLETWWQHKVNHADPLHTKNAKTVWVLCDLYAQYQEPKVGMAVLSSLRKLGLNVQPVFLKTSPRALMSQGLLKEAKKALEAILVSLSNQREDDWVVGIEPSELLVWRDEAPRLIKDLMKKQTQSTFLLYEEAVLKHNALCEIQFKPLNKTIKVHTHCHQKSLAKQSDVIQVLQLIPQAKVEQIHSGCCGMSGDFGYRHYDVSVKIAEQAVLPAVNSANEGDLIVATGTSCRHQIADLTERKGLHTAEVLNRVL